MDADNYVTQPTAWVVIGKYMNVDETFTYLKSVPNRLVGEQDPVFAKAKTRQEATELAYVFTNSIITLKWSEKGNDLLIRLLNEYAREELIDEYINTEE